jgi:glucosamine--fructose-6-phosphate aminotransferase (isomerizing)
MNGALMAAEMAEQPRVLAELLLRRGELVDAVRQVLPAHLCGVILVARGSSDQAALYGRYLLEMVSGRPVALASPSLHTLYRAPVDHSGYLAIAVSQSGRTPEIISVLERMRDTGARTIAIVNAASSPLCGVADVVIDVGAGEERAVPATKTYTATVLALSLLAGSMGTVPWTDAEVAQVPDLVAQALADDAPARAVAECLSGADRVLATARGILLSAASETALKIRETTSLFAEALSVADLRHGAIAAVTTDVPVLAFAAPGPPAGDVDNLVSELRARGVRVSVISPDPGADLSLPATLPETLQPVVAAVRGQQIAMHCARARRLDPDAPHGLSKVTLTR